MRNPVTNAINYLVASGASCVSVFSDGRIKTGSKPDRHAASVWWLPATYAIPVSRQARREVGENPDVAAIEAALRQTAADHGATLKPHEVAIEPPVQPLLGSTRLSPHCAPVAGSRSSTATTRRLDLLPWPGVKTAS
jgi:hypothetical protein